MRIVNDLRRLKHAWNGFRSFKAMPRQQRRLVFYSEGPGYWTYFQGIFEVLQAHHGESVMYVTSSEQDPVYKCPPHGILPFYVGKGSIRTLFFASLDADVLVMTMPDLHSFHIKRSPHPVHYVYLHHSMVSTHMVYRPEAFDHFDSILCVGPHHFREIRHREAMLSLGPKLLVEHGYGRLDTLLRSGNSGPLPQPVGMPRKVLIAPSWGANSTLNLHGVAVIRPLIAKGLQVILRPHPQTRRLSPQLLDRIVAEFASETLFSVDENGDAHESLAQSDVMVSDWSGAALEFALGLERPVIFIDVPRKVLNAEYNSVEIEPLEVMLRNEIGVVVTPDELPVLGDIAFAMIETAGQWQAAARAAREHWVFNVGSSGSAGAKFLAELLH